MGHLVKLEFRINKEDLKETDPGSEKTHLRSLNRCGGTDIKIWVCLMETSFFFPPIMPHFPFSPAKELGLFRELFIPSWRIAG